LILFSIFIFSDLIGIIPTGIIDDQQRESNKNPPYFSFFYYLYNLYDLDYLLFLGKNYLLNLIKKPLII